jgi:hypothetical protein
MRILPVDGVGWLEKATCHDVGLDIDPPAGVPADLDDGIVSG